MPRQECSREREVRIWAEGRGREGSEESKAIWRQIATDANTESQGRRTARTMAGGQQRLRQAGKPRNTQHSRMLPRASLRSACARARKQEAGKGLDCK